MKFWLQIFAAVAAVWLVAAGAIHFAHSAKPTPESVAIFLQTTSLDGKPEAERAKLIDKGAAMLTRLSYEERTQLRQERVPEKFFATMTKDEQGRFLDATLPSGFKQMMEAFNKMKPEKRREFVKHALEDMKKHEGETPPQRDLDDPNVRRIIEQGLRSFYSDASADVKLDLAPLIEQMQRNLQGL
jgi:hypothetical protein